jgi:hypothetical protein
MYGTLLAEKLTNAIQNVNEMGDYAWSEHIVTVFLACQITIKNIQVQLTVKGKTTPDSYTPSPKSSCAQNVVVLK